MKVEDNREDEKTKDIGPNKSLGDFCGLGIYLAPKVETCMG